jgi:phosphoglycolate phosphatase
MLSDASRPRRRPHLTGQSGRRFSTGIYPPQRGSTSFFLSPSAGAQTSSANHTCFRPVFRASFTGCGMERSTTGHVQSLPQDAQPRAVVFDFDYTLADSSQGVIDCVNGALSRLGLCQAPADRIRRTIGLTLGQTFDALVPDGRPYQREAFPRLFIQRADHVMVDGTFLLEPVPRVIRRLWRCGLPLAIVSTKFRRRITAILERDHLLQAFQAIVGGEDVSCHKPDPEGLSKALHTLGQTASACVYVGDSAVDAETARRARMPFVAVLTGTTRRDAFRSYAPHAVIEDLCELPRLVGC